jgi:hypothetical protein
VVRNLAFFIVSDQTLMQVVQLLTTLVFAGTLPMLFLVLLLRLRLFVRERRREKLHRVWTPLLARSVEIPTADVPRLEPRDLVDFLMLWNHLHETLLADSKDHLNELAFALRIDEAAARLLRRGNLREKLLAIMTLGELHVSNVWDDLLRIARSEGALLSVVAARALVMIDAEKAAPELVPILVKRSDWPINRVAQVLQTAGPDVISNLIAEAALEYSLERKTNGGAGSNESFNVAKRLIQFFPLTHRNLALPAVREIVESSDDPEVMSACLQLLRTSLGLPFARDCVKHSDFRVRVQAASALGRIGTAEDEPALISLLSDQEWWVRYRAAQALLRLPFMNESRLTRIQTAQTNPFARDMLTHVMAEGRLQ